MKSEITLRVAITSVFMAGCTHTIKPDADLRSYYSRIEKLSQKREARIIVKEDSLELKKFEYIASSIRISVDSLHFYCPSMMKECVLSNQKIDRIIFNSGANGAVEGFMVGFLVGIPIGVYGGANITRDPVDSDPVKFYWCASLLDTATAFIGLLVGVSLGKYIFLF
jgi:hypothetical protein